MHCPYGGSEISLHIDPSIPVECPMCGAIRKISSRHIWTDMIIYPPHQEPDSSRSRRRYKRVYGNWQIVEEYKSSDTPRFLSVGL